MENTELMKETKHLFLTYRNGIVADTLRKAGMTCYNVIFGLQLPQIKEIAAAIMSRGLDDVETEALADALWNDRGVRESRLLACRLHDKDAVDKAKALDMALDVQTEEEADILCFFLLRHHPCAGELAETLEAQDAPLPRYCGKALKRNLEAMR